MKMILQTCNTNTPTHPLTHTHKYCENKTNSHFGQIIKERLYDKKNCITFFFLFSFCFVDSANVFGIFFLLSVCVCIWLLSKSFTVKIGQHIVNWPPKHYGSITMEQNQIFQCLCMYTESNLVLTIPRSRWLVLCW